ncbi:hypothetical protein Glove_682g30 [Diversispora epigaea]|uniref:Uncharacterized protein n=1 Tax=Diversispora epigaea TaxID=1348612 RepID=A0A397G2M2_9GLOM|nr:hypothetical protein Glove_682g30 [Diversispora epigaea]
MRSLAIFLIVFSLFTSLVFTHPAIVVDEVKRATKEIHISSPGPGPWRINSLQAISWWSSNIATDAICIATIKSEAGVVLFTQEKKNGIGTVGFTVGSSWPVGKNYYANVCLKSDSSVCGTPAKFTITK